MTSLYLFDIEGTTTDINFVHKVLFPYAAQNMQQFILNHQDEPVVAAAIAKVRDTVSAEENKKKLLTHEVTAKLLSWIKEDRKHPALKEIQGLIWDQGYTKNHFKGHVYPDVLPFFKLILSRGHKIGIYSSGSVHAQKLIFGFSLEGDLTPLISCYFDTKVGAKREKSSYAQIALETGLSPREIHFFSDISQELGAAEAAGLKVTLVSREGCKESPYECITSFNEVSFT
ncbi:MAG TPA: acireductone synthase [Bacteriovoracaceae bacterium]|nr:acireductone synthase [Bacteriovoracaceae bacterium]